MKKITDEGRKVDYVFGDLTEIPISTKPLGDDWDFLKLILKSSMEILKNKGKFMTHVNFYCKLNFFKTLSKTSFFFFFSVQGNSAALPEALKMYEDELLKLCVPVSFTKDIAFIPSFYEEWVFYQISKS